MKHFVLWGNVRHVNDYVTMCSEWENIHGGYNLSAFPIRSTSALSNECGSVSEKRAYKIDFNISQLM